MIQFFMQGSEKMEENGNTSNDLNTGGAPPANGGTPNNSQDSATDLSTSNHVIGLLIFFSFFV